MGWRYAMLVMLISIVEIYKEYTFEMPESMTGKPLMFDVRINA